MISSNDFRPGVHVVLDGDLYRVIESAHVKIGRGSAYVKAKIRNMKTGSITERTFRAAERVPQAYLDKRPMQYLYAAGDERVIRGGSFASGPADCRLSARAHAVPSHRQLDLGFRVARAAR